MQHSVSLIAGQTARVQIAGSYFLLMDVGLSTSLTVSLKAGTYPLESVTVTKKGLKLRGAAFDAMEFTSANDATVSFVVSDGLVDIDMIDGANVLATLSGANDGSVAKPLNVTAVTVADSPATAVSDNVAIAVGGAAAVQIAAANANRRELRIANTGTDPMAIGGAGITWATRTVVIQPGDTNGVDVWVEGRFANLAVYAITDAGKAASAHVQEVIA